MGKAFANRVWVVGLLIGFMAASGARAGSVVQSRMVPTQSFPQSQAISFDPFDDSLGTLTGITLSGQVHLTTAVNLFNSTSTAQPFSNAFARFCLLITAPDGLRTGALGVSNASGSALLGFNTFGAVSQNRALPALRVPSSLWADFEEKSTPHVAVNVASSPGAFGGRAAPGVFFGGSGSASETLTLEYDYIAAVGASPVPFPSVLSSAFALIALYGGGRLIATRRRI